MSGTPAGFRMYAPAGGWSRRDAWHLLNRAQFGATAEQVERAHAEGMQATVERLLSVQDEPSEFLEAEGILRRAALASENIADLKAWWIFRMLGSANPLVERMTLCWHNHFATSYAKVLSVAAMYEQNELIRSHAVGDFRALLHGIARNPAMLTWLDGNANRKRAANENFARELMELFSLGVGNYTEQDIEEAARAFTGWHVRDNRFWFNSLQHDETEKTVFGQTGNWNGDDIVELCLQQSACPRFLAVKVLTQLVSDRPPAALIDQFAERIRDYNFDMKLALSELLQSEWFYSLACRQCMIKSPLDIVVGSQRVLHVQPKLAATVQELAKLGQDVFEPPNVKGWEGGRNWIHSATMLHRANYVAELVYGDRYATVFDPGTFPLAGLESPAELTDYFVELLLARDIAEGFREELIRAAKANNTKADRVRTVVHLLMTAPEFQLI